MKTQHRIRAIQIVLTLTATLALTDISAQGVENSMARDVDRLAKEVESKVIAWRRRASNDAHSPPQTPKWLASSRSRPTSKHFHSGGR